MNDAVNPRSAAMSARRIATMAMRYWYLLRRSPPRLLDLFYAPVVNIVLWGFLNQFLAGNSSYVAKAGGVLLAGMFLWDVMFRSQLGVAVGFLEEVWSRNLGHLFVSPLRAWEWLLSLVVVSIARTLVGLAPAVVVAMLMYHFSLFDLGLPLAGFLASLMMMGWWLALLIVAAILRWGQGAENLAWAAAFVLSPISAIYYPVATLPGWLRPLALALPGAHVFEGMRAVMVDHVFLASPLAWSFGLNLSWLAAAGLVFLWAFRNARRRGALLQLGE
jgi:ABC-2 type transport system permease protein